MTDANAIKEHMEVIGADGVHVGTVDCVKGDRIVLSKSDSTAQMEQSGSPPERDRRERGAVRGRTAAGLRASPHTRRPISPRNCWLSPFAV